MNDSPSSDDDLVLAFVDGTLAGDALATMNARLQADPALRAEVEGLLAVRRLLGDDARWGQEAGRDVPPPHLVDAIVRAEVLARPHDRPAAAPPDARTMVPWWSRLSAWWLRGSLVGAGAAAVLLAVVTRPDLLRSDGDRPAQALVASAPGIDGNAREARTAEAAAATPNAEAVPPPALQAAASVSSDAVRKNEVASAANATEDGALAAAGQRQAAQALATRDEGTLEAGGGGWGISGLAVGANRATESAPGAHADDDGAAAPPLDSRSSQGPSFKATSAEPSAPEAPPAAARAGFSRKDSLAEQTAPSDDLEKVRRQAREAASNAASGPPARPSAEAAEGSSSKAAASGDADRRSARAAPASRDEFLRELALRKGDAKSAKGPAALAELKRARVVESLNELYAAALHELSAGRYPSALELAMQAQASDSAGVLGGLPLSLQVRAQVGLQRHAEAARLAPGLLSSSPAEPMIVDGLLAGADAAVRVGDRALAVRLLRQALSPANQDRARRTAAEQRLESLSAGTKTKR
jgi:hypothetical protein